MVLKKQNYDNYKTKCQQQYISRSYQSLIERMKKQKMSIIELLFNFLNYDLKCKIIILMKLLDPACVLFFRIYHQDTVIYANTEILKKNKVYRHSLKNQNKESIQNQNKMERQQYRFMKPFLDISEFVLISLESAEDLPRPIPEVEVFEQESTQEPDTISIVDFLTPLYQPLDIMHMEHFEEFQLQSDQSNYGLIQQQQKQESEFDLCQRNRNLLDLIQQQYERKCKINIENIQAIVGVNDIQLKRQKSVKSETNYSTDQSLLMEENQKVKYYNFLTFKENNIEFSLCERNSKYFNETRKEKVHRFFCKKIKRNWNKKVAYHCRKQVADSRLRVKGRFIKRNQADCLLGLDTSNMQLKEIRSRLQTKFQDDHIRTQIIG